LNGYEKGDEIPSYRIMPAEAKGNFCGAFGSQWNNVPIPCVVLEERQRPFARKVHLRQAVSAFEHLAKSQHLRAR